MTMTRWAIPLFICAWAALSGLILYGWLTPQGGQSEHWQTSWYQLVLGISVLMGTLALLMVYLQRRALNVIAHAIPEMVEHGVGYQIRNADRYGDEAVMFNRLSRRLASTLAEVEAKRSLLGEALDNVDGVILMVDGRGRVDLITPYVSVIFGWQTSQLVEHPVSLLLPEYAEITSRLAAESERLPPEGAVRPTIAHCQNGEVRGVQMLLQHRSQGAGFVLLIRDVTLELQAERETGLLRNALDASGDGVLLFDDNGRLSWSNRTAAHLLTDSTEPLTTDQDYMAIMTRALLNGRFPDGVVEPDCWLEAAQALYDNADGSRDHRHTNGRWLREQSTRTRHGSTLTIFTDITTEKEGQLLSDEKRQLAEAACEERSQFLAVMSHEIRTPLNGMLGMLELIQDESDPLQAQQYCEVAVRAGQGLNTLINDLLDLSSLQNKELTLNLAPCQPEQLLVDVMALMQPLADDRGLQLRLERQSPVPEWVRIDAGRVRQILLNLIGNAIKFTAQGQVTVELGERSGCLQLAVRDTGPGIEQSQIASLFDAFKRLDTGFSRQQSGAGLGLAISQRLAECMGSMIQVTSQLGQGSCFAFSLPVEVVQAPVSEPSMNTPSTVSGCHILVAEDNEVNRMITREMLIREGHQVTLVENGREAVERVSQATFDLILMDISMPEMDGMQASRAIRAGGISLPIIAMTAHSGADEVEQFLACGMDDHLAKPCRRPQLRQMIERWARQGSQVSPPVLIDTLASGTETVSASVQTSSAVAQPVSVDLSVLQQIAEELDPEMLPELISIFVRNVRQQQGVIRAALRDQDVASMQRETHSLKSSAGAYGLTRIQALAQEVEELCKRGAVEQVRQPASALLDELEPALLELEALDYSLIS